MNKQKDDRPSNRPPPVEQSERNQILANTLRDDNKRRLVRPRFFVCVCVCSYMRSGAQLNRNLCLLNSKQTMQPGVWVRCRMPRHERETEGVKKKQKERTQTLQRRANNGRTCSMRANTLSTAATGLYMCRTYNICVYNIRISTPFQFGVRLRLVVVVVEWVRRFFFYMPESNCFLANTSQTQAKEEQVVPCARKFCGQD